MGDDVKDRVIEILYRNHRGEIAIRRIEPIMMRFESTDWHPEPQWLIEAWDVDKQARRSFAFKDILPAPLVWSSERPNRVGKWAVRYKDPADRTLRNWWVIEVDDAYLRRSAGADHDAISGCFDLEFCLIPEPIEPPK